MGERLSLGAGFFLRGGPVMFVLLVLSVLTLAIILTKLGQFRRSELGRTGFIENGMRELARGEFGRLTARLARSRHPVARVLEEMLEAGPGADPAALEAVARRTGMSEIRALESRLRDLELIGAVAPLLGLLGTVLGMIEAFAQVESFGASVDPSLLAGGIWQALLTTAFGLIVAIPALSASYLMQNKVDRVRDLMSETATEALRLVGIRPEPARPFEVSR